MKTSSFELKDLTSLEKFAKDICRCEESVKNVEEVEEYLSKHFLFGYEVVVDGKLAGYAYATRFGRIHCLDGYNFGYSPFHASLAGKTVCKRLFKEYSQIIYTIHKKDRKDLHVLARRIGFVQTGTVKGFSVFRMERNHG